MKLSFILVNFMHMDLDKANTFIKNVKSNPEIKITTDFTEADVVILYTCAFGIANKKCSIQMLADILINCKFEARVIVTGCLLKTNITELKEIMQFQNPTFEIMSFEDVTNEFIDSCNIQTVMPIQNIVIISEGCRFKCSYCTYSKIFPVYKSKSLEEIYKEVELMEATESTIYITGAQETSSYGMDFNQGIPIIEVLMDKLATDFPSVNFVIGWFHPAGLTDSMISVIENHKNIVEIMLHIQHVNPEILKSMRRPDFSKTMNQIMKLRNKRKDLMISTEVIVGFPGETEEQFQELVDFLNYHYFDDIGVASYEAVPKTIATNLPNQISYDQKVQRMNIIAKRFNATCYPTEENSNIDLVCVYQKAQEKLLDMPCFIRFDNQQFEDIASTDTEIKLCSFDECIMEIVSLITSARTDFDFKRNYNIIHSKYSKDALKFFETIVQNGNFKITIKERADKLLN